MTTRLLSYALAALLTVAGCKDKPKDQTETKTDQIAMVKAPVFDADSAYRFIEQQIAFGPRVTNTVAHQRAGDYMMAKLKQYGFEVTVQNFSPTAWNGTRLNARNIIGSFNPQVAKRILLAAHWDSRPFADQDSVQANRTKPVLAANDAASGVAVLLEIARTIQQSKQKPTVGIDIIFFDAEDWGSGDKVSKDYEPKVGDQVDFMGFCLGSRYWANNPHKPGYSAYYGVVLDMVGAKGATFMKEGYSNQFAGEVVNNLWKTASQLGYSQQFVDQSTGPITDDHVALNLIAKIPTVDVVHYGVAGFFSGWHTTHDDLSMIDKGTLKAVGQTLVQALYNEQ
ncbi:MAG: M20/M25/M40 family metallo-hydrolase [Bacteroidetes bacterium]|nr:M20/M25/M40 family metallo-hydrolase [Fibrella sp.]